MSHHFQRLASTTWNLDVEADAATWDARMDVTESFDVVPALTPEEEQGLEVALDELDRGEGSDLEDLRADFDAIVRR